MRIEVLADEAVVAVRAAEIIAQAVRMQPAARLGLPTGATPVLAYAELNRRAGSGTTTFSNATLFAIDEFAGVPRETPGTNDAFYADHLRLGRSVSCPDAGARDPDNEITAFAGAIERDGGLDLCVLGIGVNGHIAFNEPGAGRDSRARAVALTEASRAAHAESFGALEKVPRRGMTLGVAEILAARQILVLATGARKADIVQRALEGPMSAAIPASWLREHGDVTWLIDSAAASLLDSARVEERAERA